MTHNKIVMYTKGEVVERFRHLPVPTFAAAGDWTPDPDPLLAVDGGSAAAVRVDGFVFLCDEVGYLYFDPERSAYDAARMEIYEVHDADEDHAVYRVRAFGVPPGSDRGHVLDVAARDIVAQCYFGPRPDGSVVVATNGHPDELSPHHLAYVPALGA